MAVHYPSPRITCLDDVLPHLDEDCFKVSEKETGHTFINYKKMGNDTFPAFTDDADFNFRSSVRRFDPVDGDPTIYLSAAKTSDDLDEGIIIEWINGHRAKVKTDVYTTLHRVKESARTERTLVTAILSGEVDDLLPLVPEEDRAEIVAYNDVFWRCMKTLGEDIDIDIMYHEARLDFGTKKDFATKPGGRGDMTPMEASIVFALWDGKKADGQEAAGDLINHGLSSETKWKEMKQNLAMATKLHNFNTNWDEREGIE